MCGIAGFVQGKNNKTNINCHVVGSRMADAIKHRGPDDKGIWIDDESRVVLSYQRLAVIDLSKNGNQPMISQNNRWVIVYNGEIYNHNYLRKNLEEAGCKIKWKGTSDTETLLACIEHWGLEKSLNQLVGMFSFSLWDKKTKRLFLARDRFGEKPLYYGYVNKCFVFASEINSFKVFPGFQKRINQNALHDYLSLNVVPNEQCIYENVFKLTPGSFLCLENDSLENQTVPKSKQYWSIKNLFNSLQNKKFSISENEVNQEIKRMIEESVKQQLISDVPIGVFLSGGIDSSLITAIAMQNSNKPIKTFSIGFKEKDYDESKIAHKIANHLKTDHTNYELSFSEATKYIESMGSTFDEPFGDSSQIPMKLICEMSRKDITVALTGDGGDEIFGGYNRHILSYNYWPKLKYLPHFVRKMIFSSVSPFYNRVSNLSRPSEKLLKISRIIYSKNEDDFYSNLVTNNFNSNKILHLENNQNKSLYNLPNLENSALNISEKLMIADLINYLPDDILVKSDRCSMSVGLEVRSPFLDHRILEFYSKVPFNYKISKKKGKLTLRKILNEFVPSSLIERPKMGFSIPLDNWLKGSLKNWAEDLFAKHNLSKFEFFDSKEIQNVWHDHINNKRRNENLIWSLLMFIQWHQNQ